MSKSSFPQQCMRHMRMAQLSDGLSFPKTLPCCTDSPIMNHTPQDNHLGDMFNRHPVHDQRPRRRHGQQQLQRPAICSGSEGGTCICSGISDVPAARLRSRCRSCCARHAVVRSIASVKHRRREGKLDAGADDDDIVSLLLQYVAVMWQPAILLRIYTKEGVEEARAAAILTIASLWARDNASPNRDLRRWRDSCY